MTRAALPWAELTRRAGKMSSHRPDNGLMHYGSGMPGSLCGVHGDRKETTDRMKANCTECVKLLRSRP